MSASVFGSENPSDAWKDWEQDQMDLSPLLPKKSKIHLVSHISDKRFSTSSRTEVGARGSEVHISNGPEF